MNEDDKTLIRQLRGMHSAEAARWLIENFPIDLPAGHKDSGRAVRILPHMSWKRADQKLLADYYLKKLPHAHDSWYRAFAGFMSLPKLIGIIEENMPSDPADRSLLFYYLLPALKDASKNDFDESLVDALSDRYG